mmetsp:Transcript_46328/g.83753  ORF Transcript_46328/g.83753 Transcript_46328/m.83753 type:complete len:214 (-) Transcript_46328:183-824(-)
MGVKCKGCSFNAATTCMLFKRRPQVFPRILSAFLITSIPRLLWAHTMCFGLIDHNLTPGRLIINELHPLSRTVSTTVETEHSSVGSCRPLPKLGLYCLIEVLQCGQGFVVGSRHKWKYACFGRISSRSLNFGSTCIDLILPELVPPRFGWWPSICYDICQLHQSLWRARWRLLGKLFVAFHEQGFALKLRAYPPTAWARARNEIIVQSAPFQL